MRRIGPDWVDLADLAGVRPHQRARFPHGDEPRALWEWLEARGRLGELAPALRALDRDDLADLVDVPPADAPAFAVPEPLPDREPGPWALAADGDLAAHWLPRARGADPDAGGSAWNFTGREAAVARIAIHLTAPDAPRAPLVVLGEPGCGKSALLAHVLVLADPALREDMPRRYRTPLTDALTGAVDLAIRATGKTLPEVIAAVARAAGSGATDAARLVTAVHARPGGLRIVVDALDEADPAHLKPIALLLRQLSLDPDGHGTRVVVSVRRAPDGSGLAEVIRLSLRATPATTLEADRAPFLVYGDVVGYVERRLEGSGARPTPYTGQDTAGRVARAVVTRAGGNFLVAQLASRNLADGPEPVDTGQRRWWAEFPVDVESAMDQYLARFGGTAELVRELLTPLAFAFGDGLPDNDVWVVAATALSGGPHTYRRHDLAHVLERAATYLVAHPRPGGRTYRLFHDALAQYLRNRCPSDAPERALVRAWRAHRADWAGADRYLITYLSRHAAAGGELDDLLLDPLFVASAEPANLTVALGQVRTDDGRRIARVYRQIPATAAPDPAERAAYLALSAQRFGEPGLRDALLGCGLDLPWSVMGGVGRPPDEHDVVLWLEDATTAVTLLPAADGAVYVMTGDRAGRLRTHELADGVAFPAPDVAAHAARVTALAGHARPDGLHLLVSAAQDGEVRLWQADAGLVSPAGAHRLGEHAIIAAAVAWTPDGALVAAGDTQGAVALLRFADDGTVRLVAEATVEELRRVAVHSPGDTAPLVVAATSTGLGVLLTPDGSGGFEKVDLKLSRWSITALGVDDRLGAIVFGTGGREVHLFDPPAGPLGTIPDASASGISALGPIPADGLLIGDFDGGVQYWTFDADGGLSRQRLGRPHQDEVLALALGREPTGPRAVSAGRDRKVATWDPFGGDTDGGEHPRDPDLVGASPGPDAVTMVMLEGADTELWQLREGRELDLVAQSASDGGVAVTGTVDGEGVIRRYRSELDTRTTGSRRPIRLQPYRGIALDWIEGTLTTLALRADGGLDVYSGDDYGTPATRIATGVVQPISLSLGRLGDGEPVVGCGDPDGNVRLVRWRDLTDWSQVPAWPLCGPDPRTAVAPDEYGRSVLLTGDATGLLALWWLTGSTPGAAGPAVRHHAAPITAVALVHGAGGLLAAAGDRNGLLTLSTVGPWGLATAPRHRIMLGSAVLAITPIAASEILVWCRTGAVIISWT
ncbi:AAA family ATPase [Dactylosporangium sp. CS-047395]|uniref:AAA family ATPase n=1 Tax=Dactylosporangium sp. CS-047395 TaxID=3239936 RepID=UPI003D90DB7A